MQFTNCDICDQRPGTHEIAYGGVRCDECREKAESPAAQIVNDMSRFVIVELPAPATHDQRHQIARRIASALELKPSPSLLADELDEFREELFADMKPGVELLDRVVAFLRGN